MHNDVKSENSVNVSNLISEGSVYLKACLSCVFVLCCRPLQADSASSQAGKKEPDPEGHLRGSGVHQQDHPRVHKSVSRAP